LSPAFESGHHLAPSRAVRSGEIRVVQIIGRLNIGGAAVQAITMSRELEPLGYRTLLLRGREADHEGSMDYLADELGVRPVLIRGMQRDIGPGELPALGRLVGQLRAYRPHLVHTHAAKAGTLGRVATLIAGVRPRPVIIHTYHGQSLEWYFGRAKARLFLEIERTLARASDALVAVSVEVRDDLVRLGVARESKFTVIPLGLDLRRFDLRGDARAGCRAAKRNQWGIGLDEHVITLVARLVPIKRVDRFLRIAERLSGEVGVRFVVVGDGELGQEIRNSPAAARLASQLVWAGFDTDVPSVCAASDCIVLTSDNEGTPVSLIEAQAAGIPVVSTRVGGVASAVRDGESGFLVTPDDDAAFADAVKQALTRGRQMGDVGRATAFGMFSIERMVDDLDGLYGRLLAGRSSLLR
jgi:glycosyltransferase involved in cell wall biosynthesis